MHDNQCFATVMARSQPVLIVVFPSIFKNAYQDWIK